MSALTNNSSSSVSKINLADLPPDILNLIFKEVISIPSDAVNLSLTCKHFYQGADNNINRNEKFVDLAKRLSKMQKFEQAVEIINKITNIRSQDETIDYFAKKIIEQKLSNDKAIIIAQKIIPARYPFS